MSTSTTLSLQTYMHEISLFSCFLAANSTLPDHRLTGCSATCLCSKGRFEVLHSAFLSPRKKEMNKQPLLANGYNLSTMQLMSSTHQISSILHGLNFLNQGGVSFPNLLKDVFQWPCSIGYDCKLVKATRATPTTSFPYPLRLPGGCRVDDMDWMVRKIQWK